jgi:predicted HNH restriction endonuclease
MIKIETWAEIVDNMREFSKLEEQVNKIKAKGRLPDHLVPYKRFGTYSVWYYFPDGNIFVPNRFLYNKDTTIDNFTGRGVSDYQAHTTLSKYFYRVERKSALFNSLYKKLERFHHLFGKQVNAQVNSSSKAVDGSVIGGGIYAPITEDLIANVEQSELITAFRKTSKETLITDLITNDDESEYTYIRGKKYRRSDVNIAVIKILRDFKCQICGKTIVKKDRSNYVETAYIQPKHEGGFETLNNIILLCPNHHKEFVLGKTLIAAHDAASVTIVMNNEQYKIDLDDVQKFHL